MAAELNSLAGETTARGLAELKGLLEPALTRLAGTDGCPEPTGPLPGRAEELLAAAGRQQATAGRFLQHSGRQLTALETFLTEAGSCLARSEELLEEAAAREERTESLLRLLASRLDPETGILSGPDPPLRAGQACLIVSLSEQRVLDALDRELKKAVPPPPPKKEGSILDWALSAVWHLALTALGAAAGVAALGPFLKILVARLQTLS
jgi:hypothetical protein